MVVVQDARAIRSIVDLDMTIQSCRVGQGVTVVVEVGDCSPQVAAMRGKVSVTQACWKRSMDCRAGSERVSHSGILGILGMGSTFWWSG